MPQGSQAPLWARCPFASDPPPAGCLGGGLATKAYISRGGSSPEGKWASQKPSQIPRYPSDSSTSTAVLVRDLAHNLIARGRIGLPPSTAPSPCDARWRTWTLGVLTWRHNGVVMIRHTHNTHRQKTPAGVYLPQTITDFCTSFFT